jgi:branched-chain amino acid transport system substrate-binding protein
MKNICSLLAVVLSAVLILGGCTKNENEILVGEFGSLTGGDATFGKSTNMGIRMALDEQNAKGGIKGKKIKLITLDDQGKSE